MQFLLSFGFNDLFLFYLAMYVNNTIRYCSSFLPLILQNIREVKYETKPANTSSNRTEIFYTDSVTS